MLAICHLEFSQSQKDLLQYFLWILVLDWQQQKPITISPEKSQFKKSQSGFESFEFWMANCFGAHAAAVANIS